MKGIHRLVAIVFENRHFLTYGENYSCSSSEACNGSLIQPVLILTLISRRYILTDIWTIVDGISGVRNKIKEFVRRSIVCEYGRFRIHLTIGHSKDPSTDEAKLIFQACEMWSNIFVIYKKHLRYVNWIYTSSVTKRCFIFQWFPSTGSSPSDLPLIE